MLALLLQGRGNAVSCALEPHAVEEVVIYEFQCGEQVEQLASSPSGSRLLAAPIHPKEENKDCP